jgi:cobalt-zinc-cadmium efflux system membrane fusion protein
MQSVHSKVKGFVGPVEQIIGDFVRKGQVLTTISHPELVRLQRTYLETKAGLDALKKDFERKKQLATEDAASARALEQAEADYHRALAQSNGLKAELELLGFSVEKLDEGEIQSRLNIYAPISGYIHEIGINPGKLVGEEDMLYEMLDVEHMHLELQIFAKDLEKIKEGQHLEAMVPGTGKTFKGNVHRIGRMIDIEKKTALVHGHFEKDPVDVFPGTYVQAKIFVDEEKVEALPMTAIVRTGEKNFIFVEEPDGFQKVEVRLGREDGKYAEVFIPDNEKGKKVVTKGAYYLNGMEE